MHLSVSSALILFSSLNIIHIVYAGQALVYYDDKCSFKDGNFITFATSLSTTCLSVPSKSFKGMSSTSHDIFPPCKVKVYSDENCQNWLHSVSTDVGTGNCLPLEGGAGSYMVECNPAKVVPRSESEGSASKIIELSATEPQQDYIVRRSKGPDIGGLRNDLSYYQPPILVIGQHPQGELGGWIPTISNVVYSDTDAIANITDTKLDSVTVSDARDLVQQLVGEGLDDSEAELWILQELTTSWGNKYHIAIDGHINDDGFAKNIFQVGPAALGSMFLNAIEGMQERELGKVQWTIEGLVDIDLEYLGYGGP